MGKWSIDQWRKLGPALKTLDVDELKAISVNIFEDVLDLLSGINEWAEEKARALIAKAKDKYGAGKCDFLSVSRVLFVRNVEPKPSVTLFVRYTFAFVFYQVLLFSFEKKMGTFIYGKHTQKMVLAVIELTLELGLRNLHVIIDKTKYFLLCSFD